MQCISSRKAHRAALISISLAIRYQLTLQDHGYASALHSVHVTSQHLLVFTAPISTEGWPGWADLGGLGTYCTKIVYLSASGHPSRY